jgi:hypothetical protein
MVGNPEAIQAGMEEIISDFPEADFGTTSRLVRRKTSDAIQCPPSCGPKLELPTSFTRVRRIGARFDGTLQICVSDGTSMRFRTSEYDLCPLQERVLDNRREGGPEQVMC